MSSGNDIPRVIPAVTNSVGASVDHAMLAADRWGRCEAIARRARERGFDVTPHRVNRSFRQFVAWDEGRLATGYLIRSTGIKRITED